jgi:hypothetical protein
MRRSVLRFRPAKLIPASDSASKIVQAGNDLGELGPRGPNGFHTTPADGAVVVIVSVVLVSGGTTGFGLNVATAPVGRPEAVSVTGPGKDPVVIVYVAV